MSDDFEQGEGLPDDVQALLDAAGGFDEAPAGAPERVWGRLGEALDLGPLDMNDAGGEAPSEPPSPAPSPSDGADVSGGVGEQVEVISSAASSGASQASAAAATSAATLSVSKVAAIVWTASTFAVGALTGAGTQAVLTDQNPPPAPVVERVERGLVIEDLGVVDQGDVDADLGADLGWNNEDMDQGVARDDDAGVAQGAREEAPSEEVEVVTREKEGGAEASLEAERLLLTRAQRAVARGDGKEALSVLTKHERRFGRASALSEERDFLRVRAHLIEGDSDRAKALSEAFRRRYPKSIFLDALGAMDP